MRREALDAAERCQALIARSIERVNRLMEQRAHGQEAQVRREVRRGAEELSEHEVRAERERDRDREEAERIEDEMRESIVSMLDTGWTPEELADFGITPALLARLRLNDRIADRSRDDADDGAE